MQTAWCMLGDPHLAERMGQAGFVAAVADLQHGLLTCDQLSAFAASAESANVAPLVRMPEGAFGDVGYAFDIGFEAVIFPMIETAEGARALVAGGKYPPQGRRSYGPIRALPNSGLSKSGYLADANGRHLVFAMVETARTLENLNDIAATPGLDGLFVGPNDLAISLTGGEDTDPGAAEVTQALELVLSACAANDLISGIYANTLDLAFEFAARGFRLIAAGNDMTLLADAAGAMRAGFFNRLEGDKT
ncbi:MAG: aldolase/citrate lyase family protein [Pseudomonadota bacterium]